MIWNHVIREKVEEALSAININPDPAFQVVLGAIRRADRYAFDGLIQLAVASDGDDKTRAKAVHASKALHGVYTMLLQPVGDRCNLACRYCYEFARLQTAKSERMSTACLQAVLRNVLPFVDKPFSIFMHGGEPLLAGRDIFNILLEESYRLSPGSVRFGIQTNAVLLDAQWAAFFKEHDFMVGISLDGPRNVHDRNRTDRSGGGSYNRILEGVEALRQVGHPFGVTAVITSETAANPDGPDLLFDHFRSLEICDFDVHPAFTPIGNTGEANVSARDYSRFMIRLFDRWLEQGDVRLRIRSFDHLFQSMTGFLASACFRSGLCSSIIGVDANGNVLPCTRPFGAEHVFGNLVCESLPAVMSSQAAKHFVATELAGQTRTNPCEWRELCGKGGCPHERLDSDGHQAIDGRHVYCTCENTEEGYPALFSHILGRVASVLAVDT